MILWRIYTQREIEVKITKKDLKDLLILCMKNNFFFFNAQLYLQKDEGAMCSPLGPFIASIFMVELEKKRITNVITVYDKLEALCR